jgi:GTPase SAR1 family protein
MQKKGQAEESTSLCDTKFKLVFLGDMGVGKTSIIDRFIRDEFDSANNVSHFTFSQPLALISSHAISH